MSLIADKPIEELAHGLRISLGVDDHLRPDMVKVIESLKCRGYINDYVRVPDSLILDAEARFDPAQRKLNLRESVYCNAGRGDPRARWTVAHEIGHIALWPDRYFVPGELRN